MKMTFILALIVSNLSFAEEVKSTQQEKKSTVQEMVKGSKPQRKKKVEICRDCGKPEEQCDCEGYEHKKEEKE